MFDTHTHLNFELFADPDAAANSVEAVLARALKAGVEQVMIVGTTVANSRRAVELAAQLGASPTSRSRGAGGVYAAVGLHPHKAFAYLKEFIESPKKWRRREQELEGEWRALLERAPTIAVGEIGFDRWQYRRTQHQDYAVSDAFLELQSRLFSLQLRLAQEYQRSVIFHNRLAAIDLLAALEAFARLHGPLDWLEQRAVFHCCEPESSLLEYALAHHWFLGVDGDVTYDSAKQAFAARIPVGSLVLETDAPFFKPRTDRDASTPAPSSSRLGSPTATLRTHSEPSDLPPIAQTVATITRQPLSDLTVQVIKNAEILFGLI